MQGHTKAELNRNLERVQARWIALSCGVIIAALYVVGLVSGTELRHAVQTLPLWLGVVFGIRHVRMTRWFVLPMLLFWLGIMILIWLFLLGWAHVVSGHFTVTEILMTIVIGIASVLGIVFCARAGRASKRIVAVADFLIGAVVQLAAFQVSLLPGIARR